jgi:hypothetical protein
MKTRCFSRTHTFSDGASLYLQVLLFTRRTVSSGIPSSSSPLHRHDLLQVVFKVTDVRVRMAKEVYT